MFLSCLFLYTFHIIFMSSFLNNPYSFFFSHLLIFLLFSAFYSCCFFVVHLWHLFIIRLSLPSGNVLDKHNNVATIHLGYALVSWVLVHLFLYPTKFCLSFLPLSSFNKNNNLPHLANHSTQSFI